MFNNMKITKHNLYYIGLLIYVLSINIQYTYAHNEWVLSDSFMLTILQLMKYVAYIICIFHFITIKKMSFFTTIAIATLFALAIYATHTGPQRAPIFYFILLVTGIQTDFRKCVKVFFVVQLSIFIVCVLLSLSGIMGSQVVTEYGRTRSFLGYGWVNRSSYCWFFICLELLYLDRNKFKLGYSILLGAVNYYIYYKTNTVFSMLMTFGVIIYGLVNYYYHRIRKNKEGEFNTKRVYTIAIIAFLMMIIIGVALPIMYNSANPVMYQLNRMVTGRLALGKTAIARYGLHLGGNKLQWVGSSTLMFGLNSGTEYFYVDNGFLQLALEFGLLFTAFVVFIYVASIKKAAELHNRMLVDILLILAILFVFEPYTIDFGFNPFPLFFFSTISIQVSKKKRLARMLRI